MKIFAGCLIFIFFCLVGEASNIPAHHRNGREYITHARSFKKWGTWQVQGEIGLSDRKFRSGTRKAQMGLRHQVTANEKIGFHLGALTGHRHNSDWIQHPEKPGTFTWQETKDRLEGLMILETLTKRWLGTTGLAWDFRLRWHYFEHNQFQSLQTRAGLFLPRKGVSPGIQAEFSFPLNYGETGLDEFWSYGYAVIDISPQIKQVLKVGTGFYRWSDPKKPGSTAFNNIEQNIRIEVDFNYYFK